MKNRTDALLLGSIVVLAGLLIYVAAGSLQPKITNAGDTAPSFKVVSDDGKTFTPENFGGKVLVLNFWASWCPPCITETPSLEEFAKQFGPQGVVVLGISQDSKEPNYRKFIQRFGITFETARDPHADIAASYGTFQIPETYIIGRDGKVIEKVISNQNWMDPEFVARMKRLL